MFDSAHIQISSEVLSLIAEIDEFKGAWRALGTLAPERLSALRRVATIESIGSSTRIEGSQLSDREVERLLANLTSRSTPPLNSTCSTGHNGGSRIPGNPSDSWDDFGPSRTLGTSSS